MGRWIATGMVLAVLLGGAASAPKQKEALQRKPLCKAGEICSGGEGPVTSCWGCGNASQCLWLNASGCTQVSQFFSLCMTCSTVYPDGRLELTCYPCVQV